MLSKTKTSFNMCLHLFTHSSHTGKQTRIATLCKSIGHQARCPKPFTPRCKEDPDVAPRNQWTCLTTQQHGGYPIRALSSPCFLFFRPLLLTSSWMRVYGGEIICSSSPTWVYMSRKISASPGNTKGGAGWRSCRSWFWEVVQACHTAMFPSVRNASFMSSPGRFDLFVKSRSSRSAGEYQPGPLVSSWLFKSRHCRARSPHMLWTSYCGGPWIWGTFSGQEKCLFLVPWRISRLMSI